MATSKRVRPTYKAAVEWIALNDEPTEQVIDTIAEQISTLLVADLFGIPPYQVALAIIQVREKEGV